MCINYIAYWHNFIHSIREIHIHSFVRWKNRERKKQNKKKKNIVDRCGYADWMDGVKCGVMTAVATPAAAIIMIIIIKFMHTKIGFLIKHISCAKILCIFMKNLMCELLMQKSHMHKPTCAHVFFF